MNLIQKQFKKKLHFPPLGSEISGSELISKVYDNDVFKFTIINDFTGNNFTFIIKRYNWFYYVDYVDESGFKYDDAFIVTDKSVITYKERHNLPNVIQKVIRFFFFTYLNNQKNWPSVWVYEN